MRLVLCSRFTVINFADTNSCGIDVGYMNSCEVDVNDMNSCVADIQLLCGRSTSARISILSECVKMLTTVTLRDLMLTVRVDSLRF